MGMMISRILTALAAAALGLEARALPPLLLGAAGSFALLRGEVVSLVVLARHGCPAPALLV